jgi:ribosome-associated translation inhibitor RaiA
MMRSSACLSDKQEIEEHRRCINVIRSAIGYDVINSPHSDYFEELEVLLHDAVVKCDEISDKIKEHVYVFDVTVTVSRRVNVKARDEDDAEQAAIDYAISELDCSIDWNEDDVQVFRDEDEETTKVYDVEV